MDVGQVNGVVWRLLSSEVARCRIGTTEGRGLIVSTGLLVGSIWRCSEMGESLQ